jgi:hypothetical protein
MGRRDSTLYTHTTWFSVSLVMQPLLAWLLIHYHYLSGTGSSSYILDAELVIFKIIFWIVDEFFPSLGRGKTQRLKF